MILAILTLPVAYLACLAALLVKRRSAGVGISLLIFAVTIGAGAWAIMQSRASTAGIGFIFLPTLASVAGFLALLYGATHNSQARSARVLGIAALVASGIPTAIALRGGRDTIALNSRRDADQARRDSVYVRYRGRLDTLLATSGDRAADTLAALLRAHHDDRELVLAALERPLVPAAVLDTFARSPDLGIALQAVRNPSTRSETLERMYRTLPNRMYFLQALAGHPNTPPAILREIHALRPAPISGLDYWLAGNRSTPTAVLLEIARSTESLDAVRALLQHPALDCAMTQAASRGPAVRAHPDDADIAHTLADSRATRCR